jgi:hypothetical protein
MKVDLKNKKIQAVKNRAATTMKKAKIFCQSVGLATSQKCQTLFQKTIRNNKITKTEGHETQGFSRMM